MNLKDLEETMDNYEKTAERPRYTPPKFNANNWPRSRKGKYVPWKIEMVYVSAEVWRHFAEEDQKGYWSGHGSKRLYLVSYMGEDMGKFTTLKRAKEFIQHKEST